MARNRWITDGQALLLEPDGTHFACCTCGDSHRFTPAGTERGLVRVRVVRDPVDTARLRRLYVFPLQRDARGRLRRTRRRRRQAGKV